MEKSIDIYNILFNYIEGENFFSELEENYQQAIKIYSYNLTDEDLTYYKFQYGKIPTAVIIELIWNFHPEIKEEYDSFSEYHEWYMNHGDTPDHTSQWAVVIGTGVVQEEIIEDGWHRFHSYIKNGFPSIPFVVYKKI